jgi:signal transduction histidine kinase
MPSRLTTTLRRHLPWAGVWLVGSLLAALILGRLELNRLQDAFDADAQLAHALIWQRLPANDALLAQLVQAPNRDARIRIEQRLVQTHPHVLAVVKREEDASWGDEPLRAAEEESSRSGKPALAGVNLAKARYALVLAAETASYALQIDLKQMIPWQDWPMSRITSPVRLTVNYGGQSLVLQEGASSLGRDAADTALSDPSRGWLLTVSQTADSASQPFVTNAYRVVTWSELPWARMLNVALLLALLLLATRALLRQRHDRLRAQELLQLGQAGRLNTLAELAAGMARELDAPLQRAHQSIQTAERDLAHETLESVAALSHVTSAREEIRHAADVVGRLRHIVQQPELSGQLARVSLLAAVRHALDVMQPEMRRLGVSPKIDMLGPEFTVLAEHAALQQIIHNLLLNALQALDAVDPSERTLVLALTTDGNMGRLTIQDTGPGMDNRVVTRIFEPFFTTRPHGLGLGLSLCESLTASMGGTLTAFNRVPRGAEFCLCLRLTT